MFGFSRPDVINISKCIRVQNLKKFWLGKILEREVYEILYYLEWFKEKSNALNWCWFTRDDKFKSGSQQICWIFIQPRKDFAIGCGHVWHFFVLKNMFQWNDGIGNVQNGCPPFRNWSRWLMFQKRSPLFGTPKRWWIWSGSQSMPSFVGETYGFTPSKIRFFLEPLKTLLLIPIQGMAGRKGMVFCKDATKALQLLYYISIVVGHNPILGIFSLNIVGCT